MNTIGGLSAGVISILWILGVVVAILWFFMPFFIIGIWKRGNFTVQQLHSINNKLAWKMGLPEEPDPFKKSPSTHPESHRDTG